MILRNEENEIIFNTENLHLYDVTSSIEAKSTVIVNGKCISVKEFREMKNNTKSKGRWGKKANYEVGDNLHEHV